MLKKTIKAFLNPKTEEDQYRAEDFEVLKTSPLPHLLLKNF